MKLKQKGNQITTVVLIKMNYAHHFIVFFKIFIFELEDKYCGYEKHKVYSNNFKIDTMIRSDVNSLPIVVRGILKNPVFFTFFCFIPGVT